MTGITQPLDQRERSQDPLEFYRIMLDSLQARIWTSLPAQVVSYNAAAGTVVVQPTIMDFYQEAGGSSRWIQLPVLPDVPVAFPQGGGFTLTFPIQPGDECQVIFSCRCIDGWWQSGGVQRQPDLRMTDLSDAIAHFGPRSLPNVPANVSTASVQLRNNAGDTFIELDQSHNINVTAPSGNVTVKANQLQATLTTQATVTAPQIQLTGNVTVTGNLAISGSIAGGTGVGGGTATFGGNVSVQGAVTATGEGTFKGGHTVSGHTHSDPQGGTVGPATG